MPGVAPAVIMPEEPPMVAIPVRLLSHDPPDGVAVSVVVVVDTMTVLAPDITGVGFTVNV